MFQKKMRNVAQTKPQSERVRPNFLLIRTILMLIGSVESAPLGLSKHINTILRPDKMIGLF